MTECSRAVPEARVQLRIAQGVGSAQWLIVALVGLLVIIGLALLFVVGRNASSMAVIRIEAQRALLEDELEAAVQIETEHAAEFALQISDQPEQEPASTPGHDADAMEHDQVPTGPGEVMADGIGSGEPRPGIGMAERGGSRGGAIEMAHHEEVRDAAEALENAAVELRPLLPATEALILDEIVIAHGVYLASLAGLDERTHSGMDAMSFYHGNTQPLEATLRSKIQALQAGSRTRLSAAVVAARAAEDLLKVSLPLILLAASVAVVSLIRANRTRRKVSSLEDLVNAKDEFIGAVSHELRTPLTGIVGFAELLRDSDQAIPPAEREDIIASIAREGHEVASIVEDLLVAARAEIGGFAIAAEWVNLATEVAHVLDAADRTGAIGVTGSAPAAIGDSMRVRQVLRNLVGNAFRYGGDDVFIRMGHGPDRAWVQAWDDGAPIPSRAIG